MNQIDVLKDIAENGNPIDRAGVETFYNQYKQDPTFRQLAMSIAESPTGYDGVHDDVKSMYKAYKDTLGTGIATPTKSTPIKELDAISGAAAKANVPDNGMWATALRDTRNILSAVPAGVGALASAAGTAYGTINPSSGVSTGNIKDILESGKQAYLEDYEKASKGKGLGGAVASPVNLAAMAIPGVGQGTLAKVIGNGLIQAIMGAASEAESHNAQNSQAPLDWAKIGTSSAISGGLGSGLGLMSSKLGDFAKKIEATIAEHAAKVKEAERIAKILTDNEKVQARLARTEQLRTAAKVLDLGEPSTFASAMKHADKEAARVAEFEGIKNSILHPKVDNLKVPDFFTKEHMLSGGIGGLLANSLLGDVFGHAGATGLGVAAGMATPWALRGVNQGVRKLAPHAGGILEAAKLSPYAGQYLTGYLPPR